ncbi:hypothetical protein [Streptomyces viridosporus]|uniref:hypothetical protein n=1 Tax=Streptomyces viridosporus TaxID=67581 RepID=UPI0036FF60DD
MTSNAADVLAELEERVRSGDETVTPEEVEHARGLARFAELRKVAAERRAAAEREQQQAAAREQALAEARAILAEVTDDDVTAAVEAAGEAMARLRAVVRARNDVQERALRRLQTSPVQAVRQQIGGIRGEPRPTYPDLGHGRSDNGRSFLWLGGRPVGPLDEAALMDKARKMPAARDTAEQQARQREAEARRIELDAALYREDRAAFEQLPAVRRKPALEHLGVSWERHLEQRERALKQQAQGV